jgi:uncharacterized protein (TIGR02265 family)
MLSCRSVAVSFTVLPQDTLVQPVDPDARMKLYPPGTTVKGLFFARLAALGSHYAWRDYPQVDYARLTYDAAHARFPQLPLAEGLRRVARDDFATFAREASGMLALAFVRTPQALLTALPRLYKMVLKGGTVHVNQKTETHVDLEYRDFFGQLDCYVIGQLEGMIQHYGAHPRIDVRLVKREHAFFRVGWTTTPSIELGRRLAPVIDQP